MPLKPPSPRFVKPKSMADVPLFVDDDTLIRLLVPPSHYDKIRSYFKTFEDKHFPQRDLIIGDRRFRAVKDWLDRYYGLSPNDHFAFPLFIPDKDLGVKILGPDRSRQWPHLAKYLEFHRAMPMTSAIFGGRYWPALVEYFGREKHTNERDREHWGEMKQRRTRGRKFEKDTPDVFK